MEDVKTAAPSIREMMPPGFTRILRQRTDCKQKATISDLVLSEDTTAKYWPAVVQLAKETNPEGFARWEAAHLQAA